MPEVSYTVMHLDLASLDSVRLYSYRLHGPHCHVASATQQRPCRSCDRLPAASSHHRQQGATRKVVVQVRQFVAGFRASGRRLDVLVCNAAIYQPTAKAPSFTADGRESSRGPRRRSHVAASLCH